MHVIAIDVSHFYDSIDFLGIYRLFDDYLNEQEKNILKELVAYNEKLMRRINGSRRKCWKSLVLLVTACLIQGK